MMATILSLVFVTQRHSRYLKRGGAILEQFPTPPRLRIAPGLIILRTLLILMAYLLDLDASICTCHQRVQLQTSPVD